MTEQSAQPGEMSMPQDHINLLDSAILRKKNAVAEWLNAHPTIFRVVLWGVVLGSIITGAVMFFTGRLKAEDVGYTGAFLINLIGSASVIIPVPGLAAVCGAAAPAVGLSIFLLGLAGAAGSTIGEVTGYLAGYGGQSFVQKSRYYGRIHSWVMRRGAVTLFVLAALPLPLFDIAGIASGSVSYPLKRFLFWVFLGKIIKFILIGYACQQSIGWLTEFISF